MGRVTNLFIHVLIGLSLVLAGVLQYVPKPVLQGVFLFMGVSSLNGNELFERIGLWFIWEESKYPQYPYVKALKSSENSSMGRIHLFTVFQLICLGILYALKSIKAVAVVFPFFIASLVFIRWGFKKIFTEEELEALDGHGGEEDEIPVEDPESPLKRKATPEDAVVQMKAIGEVVAQQPQQQDEPVLLGRTALDSGVKPESDAKLPPCDANGDSAV